MKNVKINFERRPVYSDKNASTVIGESFESVITVDGIPHMSSRFYGTEDQMDERERTISEQIRNAKVEIVR